MGEGKPVMSSPEASGSGLHPEVSPDLRSLFRIDGKRALIVGGYGGIGELVTRLFVEHGASVAVAGRSRERADTLAAAITAGGAHAIGAQVDVADRESVGALVESVVDRLGGLDILVNMAGVDLEAAAEHFSEDDWRKVLDVNLSGAFWLSQSAGVAMIDARTGGRIIQFSSTRSVAGGRRGFAAYAASKGGLNALIRQLATEWARHRITVNAVAPGFVPTELVQRTVMDEAFKARMLGRIPFGRFGTPVEMAGAALFLAAPAAGFITGQIIFVDGGVTASS
jgi:NAD(P)-dependent dehydrogenase (short-subunit alcohol dehydrogenase family)